MEPLTATAKATASALASVTETVHAYTQQQLNLQHAQALRRPIHMYQCYPRPPGILTQLKSLSAGTEIS
jgi:hypothetical protein